MRIDWFDVVMWLGIAALILIGAVLLFGKLS